jgi:hypothetical protein
MAAIGYEIAVAGETFQTDRVSVGIPILSIGRDRLDVVRPAARVKCES